MKLNKYSIFVTSLIVIVSIILAIYFNSINKVFVTDILLGVFASGFVTVIISVIYFVNERAKTLYSLKTQILKISNSYLKYSREKILETRMEIVLSLVDFDYTEFEIAVESLSFLMFNQRRTKRFINCIYEVVHDARLQINLKSYNLHKRRTGENISSSLIKDDMCFLDNYFIKTIVEELPNNNGGTYTSTTIINNVSYKLSQEIKEFKRLFCFLKK